MFKKSFFKQSRIFSNSYFSLLHVAAVQSLSHVQLFAAPWMAAHQASLSFSISQSLLTLMSTESVMASSHLIICHSRWRRLLRVLWTSRRSNQSVLKEISPGCSLEGLMLKLKLQYFGHLMRRVDSLEKTLMLGGIGARGEGDDRGWDGWMASLTQWTWVWVNSGSWWWTGRPGVLWFMGSQSRTRLSNWTERNWEVGLFNYNCPYLPEGLPWWLRG